MKYNKGSRVRVLEIDTDNEDEKLRFLNKVKEVVHVWRDNEEGYFYGLENENWSPLYFKECQLQDMNRDYVIVSTSCADPMLSTLLSFIGTYTDDDKPRSFEGLSLDVLKCERYTIDELINNNIPIYDNNIDVKELHQYGVKVETLLDMGHRQMTVMTSIDK